MKQLIATIKYSLRRLLKLRAQSENRYDSLYPGLANWLEEMSHLQPEFISASSRKEIQKKLRGIEVQTNASKILCRDITNSITEFKCKQIQLSINFVVYSIPFFVAYLVQSSGEGQTLLLHFIFPLIAISIAIFGFWLMFSFFQKKVSLNLDTIIVGNQRIEILIEEIHLDTLSKKENHNAIIKTN